MRQELVQPTKEPKQPMLGMMLPSINAISTLKNNYKYNVIILILKGPERQYSGPFVWYIHTGI
jgi:hypothetical protein